MNDPDLYDPIQILRYMGNKSKIIKFVVNKIAKEVPKHAKILDLMAGTHSISYALKGKYVVYANDIQAYSQTIGKALVENNSYLFVPKEDMELLKKYMNENLKELKINKSLIKNNPYTSDLKDHPINNYKKNNHKFPYCLFSYYYADKYWPLRNCLVIDSLKYAIDKLTAKDLDKNRKYILITCLLYAISYTVLSTGHFAQYLVKGNDLEAMKKRKVEEYFFNKLKNISIKSNRCENRILNYNYRDLFIKKALRKKIEDVDLIYFDPPYSSANYSRFYHIPETLVKYDYPECEFKGCYRENRHLSPFCTYSNASSEFRFAVKNISQLNKKIKLMISYSRSKSSIIDIREIRKICRTYFEIVEPTYEKDHLHSAQGKKNGMVKEILIVCKKPKFPMRDRC